MTRHRRLNIPVIAGSTSPSLRAWPAIRPKVPCHCGPEIPVTAGSTSPSLRAWPAIRP